MARNSYLEVSTITVSGSTVTVGGTDSLIPFIEGDLIFIAGRNPLVVLEIDNRTITLKEPSPSTYTGSASIISSNVSLREALDTIRTNNEYWEAYFNPFLDWISTQDSKSTMYDTLGNAIEVYTAAGLNLLASDIIAANVDLGGIKDRVDDVEAGLSDIEGRYQDTADAVAATAADVLATAADRVQTGDDRLQTAADALATAEDRLQTGEDSAQTVLDALATAADRVQTGEDRAQTILDAAAVAADRVQTGEDRTAVESNKVIAVDAATQAAANANFKGEWSILSGSLAVPASVKHLDTVYMLNSSLADVTTSEPSITNTDWFVLGSITGVSPDSERLGGNLPSYYVPATRTVNGKPLTGDIQLSYSDVDAVPTSRTINGKPLSSNVVLDSEDVDAVPTSRTINGKPLSSNIDLDPGDVDAVPTSRTINGKPLSSNIDLDSEDVDAVPTSRTINGKPLSSNVVLDSEDVGSVSSVGGKHLKYFYFGDYDEIDSAKKGIRGFVRDKEMFLTADTGEDSRGTELYLDGKRVYHTGYKPTSSDVGALPDTQATTSAYGYSTDLNTITDKNLIATLSGSYTNSPLGTGSSNITGMLRVERRAYDAGFAVYQEVKLQGGYVYWRYGTGSPVVFSDWNQDFSENHLPEISEVVGLQDKLDEIELFALAGMVM